MSTVKEMYGNLDNVAIITLAPEKENALEVIKELTAQNITVSVGHSMADLTDGEAAFRHGSRLITHLFNAMLPVIINQWTLDTHHPIKFELKLLFTIY